MQHFTRHPAVLLSFAAVVSLGCGTQTEGFRSGAGSRGGVDEIRNNATDDEDPGEGCTLTQGYWKNHSADGRAKDRPWPIPEDTELCGQTWFDILWTPTKGDAWYILAHQWIAAELNVASGAAPSAEVAEALDAAEALLVQCEIAPADRAAAIDLSELLDAFNNGRAGTDHCDDGDEGGEEDDGDGTDDGGSTEGGDGDDGCPPDTDGGEDGPQTLFNCDDGDGEGGDIP